MGLFNASQLDKINAIAAKSNEAIKPVQAVNSKSVNDELTEISNQVKQYFKDSKAICIKSREQLHDYVDKCIEVGYVGIDTETTGLDRLNDTIVGWSLYTPGLPECYIPCKHKVPIFDSPYKDQLTYEESGEELQRLVDSGAKLILANADFDIPMIYKDLKVDIIPNVYYDVILAWRCIKEDEKDNTLKGLYAKYPMQGQVDPKKFSDFFPVKLFPYCKPEIAALYAANDALITYKLFLWQLPYVTKTDPKCQERHLEKIADLFWNIEIPLIATCAYMHRTGIYLDQSLAPMLHSRYYQHQLEDEAELAAMVQELIDTKDIASNRKRPFRTGKDFNPNSNIHVKYLINNLMGIDAKSTGKEVLKEINKPVTQKVLDVRGDIKLLGTYVDKMPKIVGPTGRVHSTYKQLGTDTGRFASADPNTQNIPSRATDIRHLFRATPQGEEDVSISKDNTLRLKTICRILSKDAEEVKVTKLCSGNVLQLCKDNVTEFATIANKEYSSLGTVKLTLDANKHSWEGWKLHVITPPCVLISSDYSQQEPRLTAFVSNDSTLIKAFQEGRDVYATLSSISFKLPYEECLEFHPDTHEYQPDGKKLRNYGKVLNLGITYGMLVQSIAESLFGTDDTMLEDEKMKRAQEIYDAMMKGFPGIQKAILAAQHQASTVGYTETILGRRRHHPDMMLPRFEFKPMPGYVNPDIDPLDPLTMKNKDDIPKRTIAKLTKEFNNYKYYGQRVKRIKQLAEEKISVIDNTRKIDEASRQCFNAVIQGSAADLTKMAILRLNSDPEWQELGASLLLPIHDELLCEAPLDSWQEAADILCRDMCEAGNFLPFGLKCDAEVNFRWYGLAVEDILSHDKPKSLDYDSMSESNICWLQCMLCENEYLLPIYNEADGSKPKGIKSHGVNGIVSDEMKSFVEDYMKRYGLKDDKTFLDHIEKKVIKGVY